MTRMISRGRRLSAATAILMLSTGLSLASAQAEDKAAILLPGSANDQSWNALGYAIVKSLEPHGFKTAYTENVADADEAEAVRDYASQGYGIVLGHSGRFVSAMQRVAPDFPKTQFIAVSGNEGAEPNVMSIDYNNAQFGCQLGLLAAKMSKTHKVGGIYGLQGVPNITAQAGAFRLCATKAGAAVTILYIKDMEDAAQAKEAAFSLIGNGADVLTGKLNAAEAGLVQAAKEKKVYVTGRGFDQTAIAPDLVLTNIVEDWPSMIGSTADQVKAGKLFGSFVQYGYDSGKTTGASLKYSADKAFGPAVPEAVAKEVDAMAADFASGTLKITPTEQDARSGS
ncbi:BMP family protein [Rhizobium paknamense]|uniref:Simple sugar transport system substrate-binding protein/basic membrane protein A n=1 Tax=Rhizobium paknamense TaxID=1206817 RepID=A0ABU0IBK6_9HYPH|nr:BMP family protein [Rhizobium paknamense]MDQ0455614.1 simple sugar transport system substrate-binding protein/basic membrane protein A [Rhizobium paknamense]